MKKGSDPLAGYRIVGPPKGLTPFSTGKTRKDRPFQDGWDKSIASSNVIFASSKQDAVALAPNTLEILWTTPLPGLQPMAVANGRL